MVGLAASTVVCQEYPQIWIKFGANLEADPDKYGSGRLLEWVAPRVPAGQTVH